MSPRPLMEAAELSIDGKIWGCSSAGYVYAEARGPADKQGRPRMPVIARLHSHKWRYGEEKWWSDCSDEEQAALLKLIWIPVTPISGLHALAKAADDL